MQRGAQQQKHGQQWALELGLAAGSPTLWGREGTVTWRQGQVTLKDSASTHSFVFRQSKMFLTSFKIPTVDRISPNCPSGYHLDTISSVFVSSPVALITTLTNSIQGRLALHGSPSQFTVHHCGGTQGCKSLKLLITSHKSGTENTKECMHARPSTPLLTVQTVLPTVGETLTSMTVLHRHVQGHPNPASCDSRLCQFESKTNHHTIFFLDFLVN